MDELGFPSIDGISRFEDSTANLLDSIAEALPGMKAGSVDRAISRKTRRIAKDVDFIRKWGKKNNAPPELVDILVRDVMKRHGVEMNVGKTLSLAAPEIEDADGVREIDPEWYDRWEDYAGKSRDDLLQRLWARLFAQEANQHGAISKRTLSIVADMSRADAEAFKSVCALCEGGLDKKTGDRSKPTLFLTDDGDGRYGGGSLDYDDLMRLSALGLVMKGSKNSVSFKGGKNGAPMLLGGDAYVVWNAGNLDAYEYSCCVLTPYGEELAAQFELGTDPRLVEMVRADAEAKGFKFMAYHQYADSMLGSQH